MNIQKFRLIPVIIGLLSTIAISMSGNISQRASFKQMLLEEINGVGLDKLIILIALIVFFIKFWNDFIESVNWITHTLATLFSIFTLIGLSYSKLGNWDFIFANFRQFLIAVIAFAGYFLLFDACLGLLYSFLTKKNILKVFSRYKFSKKIEKHYFLFSFIVISIFWVLYVLCHLPGSVPYDGYRQINMFYGIEPISNHHPWLLTMFFGLLMNIGRNISDNFGVFLIVAVLFTSEALCYATVCNKIKKWNAPFWFNVFSLSFFSILPVFGAYSQVVMKDGIFSALFALFFVLYVDISRTCVLGKKMDNPVKMFIALFVVELLVCLTRNNGLYMILPADILLFFFVTKGKGKYVLTLTICLILSYYCLDNKLATMVGVAPGSKREMLSIPFQQTARYLKEYPDDVTAFEKESIATVLSYDSLAEIYEPEISDHVKDTFRNSSTTKELMNYFKAWFSMFLRHPGVYFEATFNNTYGYYYPFHNCNKLGAYQFYIQGAPLATGDFDISYVIPENIRSLCDSYANMWRQVPVLAQLVNPATYTWILFIMAGYLIYSKKNKGLLILVAPFLNIAVCIASPVNGYLRYAIPLIACMPVLLYWCLMYPTVTKMITKNSGKFRKSSRDYISEDLC